MKLKELLNVLSGDLVIWNHKGDILYSDNAYDGIDYDVMLDDYGECMVEELKAGQDCTSIIVIRGPANNDA